MPVALSLSTLQDFTHSRPTSQHARKSSNAGFGLRGSRPRLGHDSSQPTSPTDEQRRVATPSALSIVNDAKEFLHDCSQISRLPKTPSWPRRPSQPLDWSRPPFEEADAHVLPRLASRAQQLPSLETESCSAPPTREKNVVREELGRLSPMLLQSPPKTELSRRRGQQGKMFSLRAMYQSVSLSPPKRRSVPRGVAAYPPAECCDDPIPMPTLREGSTMSATLRDEAREAVADASRSPPVPAAATRPMSVHQSAVATAVCASSNVSTRAGSDAPPTPASGVQNQEDSETLVCGEDSIYILSPAAAATRLAAARRFGCPSDPDEAMIMQEPELLPSDNDVIAQPEEWQTEASSREHNEVAGDCGHSGSSAGARPEDWLGLPSSLNVRRDCDYWDQSSQLGEASNGSQLFDSVDGREVRNREKVCVPEGSYGSTVRSAQSSIDALPQGVVHGSGFSWSRGEMIGRGSLGSVWQGLDQQTGRMMAVKEVLLQTGDESDDRFRAALQNEVDLYKDLHHPNIVSYLGNDFIGGRLYIYLEYMPGGSIAQVLSQFGALDEPLTAKYMRNLLEGLEYLHTRDPCVLHRDIKGANILVGMSSTVKLSDFGCSKRSMGTAAHTLRGSVPWMAPEVMQNNVYGRRADIWSLGCVLIEMCTAAAPWGRFDNCLAAMVRIAMSEETPPIPGHLSEQGQDFVAKCTRRAPEERPDASHLLTHPFVAGASAESLDDSFGG